ncbi:MAG: alpha/beta fold hydrolase [Verrucomicrobiota bacterium]
MPIVEPAGYRAPFGFGNGHVQTVYPAVFRRVGVVTGRRERLDLADGDFLDLDWGDGGVEGAGRELVVILHGLEGDSRQAYVQGMASFMRDRGWDVLAWNFRGCSGEMNRLARSYHSGATEDMESVLGHVWAGARYERVALIGFSLGGNVVLKYLGEQGEDLDERICGAVAFSVPCDLASSAACLAARGQRVYMRRFLKRLTGKMRAKMALHPDEVKDEGLDGMRNFYDFDDAYTAPLHGFAGATDYWERCSSRRVLGGIRVPTLLVNAADDPFLGAACYPQEEAEASQWFYLEVPRQGGHVGFVPRDRGGAYWSEMRAGGFLDGVRG